MKYMTAMILVLVFFTSPSVFAQDGKIDVALPSDAGLATSKGVADEGILPALSAGVVLAPSKDAVVENVAPVLPPVAAAKMAPVLPPSAGLASKQRVAKIRVYQVGAGDILDINMISPVPSTNEIMVLSDGTITVPYIGNIRAQGRSIPQLQSEIQNRLTEYLNNPVVSVSLKEARSKSITIYGDVAHPGAYQIESDMSLLRAISLAGGLSVSSSTGLVKVLRPNADGRGESVIFKSDIAALLSGATQDITTLSGDTVVVTMDKFFVYGDVTHPGGYPLEENMSLLDAVIVAGGFIEGGSTGEIKLLRSKGSPKEMTLDIKAILSGEDQGVMLQAGDTIDVVPGKFYIYGQIVHPGTYSVGDNMSIMDAVTAAGGLIDSGSMGRIKVFRAQHQKDKGPDLEFDINSISDLGDQDVMMHAGDTIVVSLDQFFITGEVNHPGPYPIEKRMSLLDAIITAGGVTTDNSTAKIKLFRPNAEGRPEQLLDTDFTSVLNGTVPDIPVQASDTIVVIASKFYVYGEVNRPGVYPLESNTSAMTAISIAGGFSRFGSGNRVKVVRVNEKTGMYEIIKVNITEAIAGNSKADVLLIPGDVVVVSEGIL